MYPPIKKVSGAIGLLNWVWEVLSFTSGLWRKMTVQDKGTVKPSVQQVTGIKLGKRLFKLVL